MAAVTVKCFGVFRIDSEIDTENMEADNIKDVFEKINALIESDMHLGFSQALTYVNGDHCTSQRKKLHDDDEVWLISPTSVVEKSEKSK